VDKDIESLSSDLSWRYRSSFEFVAGRCLGIGTEPTPQAEQSILTSTQRMLNHLLHVPHAFGILFGWNGAITQPGQIAIGIG
jgi:hypothetical protein